MKRRMREAYRSLKSRLRPGLDIVVSATARMDFQRLQTKLEELLRQAGAWEGRDEEK